MIGDVVVVGRVVEVVDVVGVVDGKKSKNWFLFSVITCKKGRI